MVFVYFRLFSLSGEDVSYVIQELLWLNAVLVWEDPRKKSGVAVSSSINFTPTTKDKPCRHVVELREVGYPE